MIRNLTDSIISLVYPQVCHSCERSVENSADGVACGDCWSKTRIFTGSETVCRRCGVFLSVKESDVITFCHQCDGHFYERAIAAGIYEHALAASVLQLKRESFISTRLRHIFINRFRNSDFQDSTLIVPVPLSPKRRLERGFNQAETLAEIIKFETGIKLDKQSLRRKVHTITHRAGMDRKGRELSVKNVFEARRKVLLTGEIVLLVDDVLTSGATVSNCAKALRRSGAGKVYVLTLARTE